jgi:hypothetical protein
LEAFEHGVLRTFWDMICSFVVGCIILRNKMKMDEMSGSFRALFGEKLEQTACKI